jgi:hypothetical protein
MVKMVMISYNEAMDSEVVEALANCGVKNYTKIAGAFGKGEASGIHLGNDIWPGRNNVLYVACSMDEAQKIFSCVKELRKKFGREGIKAFLWELEDTT